MSDDPRLRAENMKAALRGSIASTSVISCLVIWAILETLGLPEDERMPGSVIGYLGLVPLIFGVLFLYYFILSIKRGRPFRFAILVQFVVIAPLSFFVFWAIAQNGAYTDALIYGGFTFCFLGLAGGLGAWFWSRPTIS